MVLQMAWAAGDRVGWVQRQCLERRVPPTKTIYKCPAIETSFSSSRLRVHNLSRHVRCLLDPAVKVAIQHEIKIIIQVNNILSMIKCAGLAIKNWFTENGTRTFSPTQQAKFNVCLSWVGLTNQRAVAEPTKGQNKVKPTIYCSTRNSSAEILTRSGSFRPWNMMFGWETTQMEVPICNGFSLG